MKTAIKLLGVLAVMASGLNMNAQTYSSTEVFVPGTSYVTVDVGGSLQSDITSATTGATISFNPGIRSDVCFGYHLTDPLAIEFETGIIWNSIDKSGGVKLSSVNTDANWYQFPLLANVLYDLPQSANFRPYLGGGIGGVVNSVRFDNGIISTSDTDVVFGYQAVVGFRYAFNSQMEIGAAYKFLGTTDNHFSRLSGLNDSTFNNSLLVQFRYTF